MINDSCSIPNRNVKNENLIVPPQVRVTPKTSQQPPIKKVNPGKSTDLDLISRYD